LSIPSTIKAFTLLRITDSPLMVTVNLLKPSLLEVPAAKIMAKTLFIGEYA
jgi:hypothetical protein